MKSWELLAAAIAVASGLWGQIRNIFSWLRGFIIVTVWTDECVAGIVADHLGTGGRSSSHDRLFSGTHGIWVKSIGKHTAIAWECLVGSSRTFWKGKIPIWYHHPKEALSPNHSHSFSFLRGTVDWEKLLMQATSQSKGTNGNWHSNVKRHRVVYHFGKNLGSELAAQRLKESGGQPEDPGVSSTLGWTGGGGSRLIGWEPADIGKPLKTAAFSALSLSKELQETVVELKKWASLKEWYAERGIPWKRGYLFRGKPGTGKTAFARATAEELDIPAHVFDLATMSNADLREAWGKMLKTAPCMVVFEDIDAIFHGRKNVTPGGGLLTSGGLTFDALLNCLDGLERSDGVLVIVTTNHPEHVDEALMDRPGRIDRVIEFKPLDFEGRLKLARRIVEGQELAFKLATENDGLTATKFVEICCRTALQGLYDQPSNDPYR